MSSASSHREQGGETRGADMAPRVAFVTGSAQGIGLAIARELHRVGMTVVMADRNEEGNQAAAADIDADGARVEAVTLDVREPDAAVAAIDDAVTRLGGLDVLVNNAAVTNATRLWDVSIDEWDDVIDTNLRSVFLLARAAGAHMRDRGAGRIVNMGSLAAQAARPSGAPYTASKAGIVALTRLFARELAPYGVTVNAIAPGPMDTPMIQAVPPEVVGRLVAEVPVGRIGRPEEIAALVAFLVSDRAGFITGATYDINGGVLMR
jgi:3-oxoacyl-[acyl-carrier protein] reductase